MRHVRTITICLAACAAAVLAASVPGAGASTPVAKLRGFLCQRSVNPVGRGVAVSAVMRPVKGTRKMALRVELLMRTKAGGPWTRVPGGDLGAWLTPSNPTLGQRPGDIWILKKSVNQLAAPAAYRYRVSFRWTGTRNRTLGTAVRTSATCNQPELRPDLLVKTIDVQPVSGHPKVNLYIATIDNRGTSAARRFRVQFTPGNGSASKYKGIKVLASHTTATVAFEGPACSTSAASTITVDPDGVVNDYNRDNNTMTAVCSSAGGHA